MADVLRVGDKCGVIGRTRVTKPPKGADHFQAAVLYAHVVYVHRVKGKVTAYSVSLEGETVPRKYWAADVLDMEAAKAKDAELRLSR